LIENFPSSKARIEFIARFLLILDPIQTVIFSALAHALSVPAQMGPKYKRLQRFFRELEPPYDGLPRLSPDFSARLDHIRRRSIAPTGKSGPSTLTF
jgi:hypothetical protein